MMTTSERTLQAKKEIIGYCTCMGIYCVEEVLLAELPELAGQLRQKNEFNTIYSHESAISFLLYTLILFNTTSYGRTAF